jgi:hypothetical protein
MSRRDRIISQSERIGTLTFVLLAGAMMACSKPDERPDPTKTFLDVNDINAKVETPPPPPPLVGKLSVFSTPVGGTCRIQRFRGNDPVGRELHYDADQPRRTIVLGISRMPRPFMPMGLQIIAMQGDGVSNEQETIVAGFGADSSVTFGTRTYFANGRLEANEKVQLSELDKIESLKFAQALMALCADVLR